MKIFKHSSTKYDFKQQLQQLLKYKLYAFITLVALVYGYTVFSINQAINISPSSEQTAVKRSPTIDPVLVRQLEQLQDNSVSVQSLFNDGRDNPFQ